LDTLKYLRRSGRMNGVVSTIGEIMHIKPILKMHAGISSVEKERTRKKGLARLVSALKTFGPFEKIGFLYSGGLEDLKSLQAVVQESQPDHAAWLGILNPVLGAHLGTGVVGFASVTSVTSVTKG
jgi:fatty acid-binding protein DegV